MDGAARKTVTVVFCDLADSTGLGERLDPEALRALFGRYYDGVRAAAERHGGTVEKYIGDAVMAVFGIPVTHEDDALRAVRAAVEMRDAARAVGVTPRIGVETGEVVSGDTAAGHGFATGSAIVTAERLEKEAGPDGILLGPAAYRLVAHAVEGEPAGALDLKGKERPVSAWRVHAVAADAPALARRLDAPLVDRDLERGALRAELEQTVAEARCRLVAVVGPAGIGKTRLVSAFLEEAAADATVLTGRCRSYGDGGSAFHPVADVVRDALALAAPDERAAPALAALAEGEHPPVSTEEAFWAVRKLLESVAAERPLVVVFDDVEWAQPTFLDLVEYLVGWSREHAILVLCLARSELLDTRPGWASTRDAASAVLVQPLEDGDVERVVTSLASGLRVTPAVTARITEIAVGNPLFAEELLRMLVDEDALDEERALAEVAVPRSVRAVLEARLDRLAPAERAAIQHAAVVGDEFWWTAVAELAPGAADGGLGRRLQELVRKQLVVPARSSLPGEDAFRFAHPLIREVAYDLLPKARRAELHLAAAAWLGERRTTDEVTGSHLERAARYHAELGTPDAELERFAARLLAAAGRRALHASDFSTSVDLLERACALLPAGSREQQEVLLDLIVARRDCGRFDEARESAARLLASADEDVAAHARLEAAWIDAYTDPDRGLEELAREAGAALGLFAERDDDVGLVRAQFALASADWSAARYDRVQATLGARLADARASGDRRLHMQYVFGLAQSAVYGSMHVDEASALLDALRDEAAAHQSMAATVELLRAVVDAMRGDLDAARTRAAAGVAVLEELGAELRLATARQTTCAIELLAGDAAAAEREARAGRELLAAQGVHAALATLEAYLALALCAQERWDEARAEIAVAESTVSARDTTTRVLLAIARASVLAATGGADAAREAALHAVELAETTDNLSLRGDAHAAAGDPQAALELYRRKGNAAAARLVSEGRPAAGPAERAS